jgi:hypothetical protein
LSALTVRNVRTVGRPKTKIKMDEMMKGDQPFNTAAHEWCRSSMRGRSSLTSSTFRGFQYFKNTTITRSEKIAATMSTRPVSTKFDQ